MKPRADYFLEIADTEAIKIIQSEVQKYKEDYEKEESESVHKVLLLYLQVAMDEGYRRVMEDMKKDDLTGSKINIVERKKGWFEYVEDHDEIKSLVPLVKRRINSKRMRNRIKKDWDKQGKEWSEDLFCLMTVIHTGWEHGYMKGTSIEETAKWVAKDQERADLLINMMKEFFPQELLNAK